MQDINYFLEDEEQVVEKKKTFFQKIKFKMFQLFWFLVVMIAVKSISRAWRTQQERKRYKKIIKKGLFWDTEYLIEKDND